MAKENNKFEKAFGSWEELVASGKIPFWAFREEKESKQEEKDLTYQPDASKDEFLVGYKYREETKPANYVLQPNERNKTLNADGTQTVEIPEKKIIETVTYQPNTGYEVKDFASYQKYLEDLKILAEEEFDSRPYYIYTSIIDSYESFKLNVIKTGRYDYLVLFGRIPDQKARLTNLCSYVEQYLKQEPLSREKRHLIEVLGKIKTDLATHKPNFWKKIKELVESPISGVPSAPNLVPEIKVWLDEIQDQITFRYANRIEADECDSLQLLLSDVQLLIKDFEVLLRDQYYRLMNNPRLLNTRLHTFAQSSSRDNEQREKNTGFSREKALQKILERENITTPLKTSEAENIGYWGDDKANFFKTEGKEVMKDNTTFDKETSGEKGGKIQQRGETKNIYQDVQLNVQVLEWLGRSIEKLMISDKIRKLDKHFSERFSLYDDD